MSYGIRKVFFPLNVIANDIDADLFRRTVNACHMPAHFSWKLILRHNCSILKFLNFLKLLSSRFVYCVNSKDRGEMMSIEVLPYAEQGPIPTRPCVISVNSRITGDTSRTSCIETSCVESLSKSIRYLNETLQFVNKFSVQRPGTTWNQRM